MIGALAVLRRELAGYFHAPAAYVFLAIFLFAAGAFTWHVGGFFEAGRADLGIFFAYHPWLLLIFMPAVAMRQWAEDYKSGSIEILFSLPAPTWALVLGKFLAAWLVAIVALALTAPIWFTVNYLGAPDNGAIVASYAGSALLAGGYLAIGSAASAATANQVVAFVVGVFAAFVVTAAGLPIVSEAIKGWAPVSVVDWVAGLSALERFDSFRRGVIEARDVIYFGSLIGLGLTIAALFVSRRRGG